MSNALAHPSLLARARPYAERAEDDLHWYDRWASSILAASLGPMHRMLANSPRRLARIVALTERCAPRLQAASDADLQQAARALRGKLRASRFAPEVVGESFALIREAAVRTLGRRHYDIQLMAGFAMVQGKLIEMATGEGKTFAATLPAGTLALAGYPVHVITVNDYLASRDAEELAPLYQFLGLSVGVVVQGLPKEARRQAYQQAITYCTNKELAFDYLRDRVEVQGHGSRLHQALQRLRVAPQGPSSELVLRGLCFGIVDEADSVFIDEARTPLILSATGSAQDELLISQQALELAQSLVADSDYVLNPFQRVVSLLDGGRDKLAAYARDRTGVWTSVRAREELLVQALSAGLLYQRDHHYVVTDGKVQIVDESTGRVMPDRSWERGLHQLIEAKEGCALTPKRETLARLTYQRLFRRYMRLAGMSGTATEVASEIKRVYRLDVARIPLHRPSRRLYLPAMVCATLTEKWQRVVDAAQHLAQQQGRPVLIGTRSVKASEEISAALLKHGVQHTLLNAKQDKFEAEVIAEAGQQGRVTVATNMAGRGTDIRLGPGVAERGGLHVILTEYHESRRVDRQLFGRCARQSDPGSCQAIISLEDEIFAVCAPATSTLLRRAMVRGTRLPAWSVQALKRLAQFSAELRNAQVRVHNMELDRRLNQALAFSGEGE